MTMSLPVRDVLASGDTFARGRFGLAVMGILAVSDDVAQILDDTAAVEEISGRSRRETVERNIADRPSDASIRIVDASFLPRLQSSVSPLNSGDFKYFDVAMICGSTRSEGNNLVLDDIWDATLYRGGKELHAWVDRQPCSDP